MDCFWFSSRNLDSLVKTPTDNNHITLKTLKKKTVGDDELLVFVKEIKTSICKDKFDKDSFGGLKQFSRWSWKFRRVPT